MRSSLSLAFCLFLASAAQAQELNVITSVEVRTEGNTVLVSVKGSKPPNFTTFSMADPARFVIDFSEAKFQGVPEDVRIEDGVIRVIKNLAYGSGATAIARVMLAFSVDVDPPDVQTAGTSLLVRMNKPAGAAVAATGSAPGSATAATTGAGATGAAGAAGSAAVATDAGAAAAEATAAAVAAASARSEAEAVRQEALARERREAEARDQARLAAETSAKEREAQARAETEARAREAEKAAAEQVAAEAAALAAADARRAEIKAKAAAEELQAQKVSGPPAATATATEPVRAADSERAARAQAEADARARREVEAALAAQPVTQQPDAAVPSRAPAPVQGTPEVPARAAKLQAVGFKQLPAVSRVFVKTSVTPRFTITDVGDDVVRLEVENTRASRRNDTRPLDTSFFPSAVALISPSRVGTSYVVDIKLKKRVPYQQKVEGDMLAIDFERPPALGEGGTPGATEAPAGPASGGPGEAALENQQGLVVDPEDKAEGPGTAGDKEPAAEPKQ